MCLSPHRTKKSEREKKYSKKDILNKRDMLKDQINQFTKYFHDQIPELEPTTRIGKLTEETFNQLEENMKHQKQNVQKAYQDGNFPRLIELIEKLSIFLVETDNHYEKWLGYFYIEVMLKMNRYYEAWRETQYTYKFPQFEKFVEWFLDIERTPCTR